MRITVLSLLTATIQAGGAGYPNPLIPCLLSATAKFCQRTANVRKRRMAILMAATQLFIVACSLAPRTLPPRPFRTSELLVTLSDMPPGWSVGYGPGRAFDERANDDASMIILYADTYTGGKGTSHAVYHYATILNSKNAFQDKSTWPGSLPPGWTFRSPVADQAVFSCYDWEGREPYPNCTWVARYQEYVVVLDTWLLPDRMSLAELDRIVKSIDRRMAAYLHR
jgi:hypothetical protein